MLQVCGMDNIVHTVFADLKLFKGLEAHCSDAKLYDDGFGNEDGNEVLQVHVVKDKKSSSLKLKYMQKKAKPQWRKKEKYIIHDEVIPKTCKYVVNAINKKGAEEDNKAKKCEGDIGFIQEKMRKIKSDHQRSSLSIRYTRPLSEVLNNFPVKEEEGAIFIVEKGTLGEEPIIFIRSPTKPNGPQDLQDESESPHFSSLLYDKSHGVHFWKAK